MTRYLCISVTFLDPLFHGKADGEVPEWPPSPLRLFQALLAGASAGCRAAAWSEEKINAFRWLESLPAPAIVAPRAEDTTGFTLFVPNNDGDRRDRQDRLTGKTVQPHCLLDGDTAHYLWAMPDSDEAHAQVLCREARHLLAFGWGIDQVVGNGRVLAETEANALPGVRWRPWDGYRADAPALRTPRPGALADLQNVYQSFLHRVNGRQYRPTLKVSRFETVSYLRSTTLPARSYAAFDLVEGDLFRQEDIVRAAAMLRSLTCRLAQGDTHTFPGGSEAYVAGHVGQGKQTPPRFSYLPLPSIGHEHADGMVRRLLIAEPIDGNGEHARWAQQRLQGAALRDEAGQIRGILLDGRRDSQKMIERYTTQASVWTTVTPVVLPGHDDGKYAKAEKLLLTALRDAGTSLEAVQNIAMRKAPYWPGAQHPRQYFLPDYIRGLPGWHVRLDFHAKVSGPLALGVGRHVGLGVFAHEKGE